MFSYIPQRLAISIGVRKHDRPFNHRAHKQGQLLRPLLRKSGKQQFFFVQRLPFLVSFLTGLPDWLTRQSRFRSNQSDVQAAIFMAQGHIKV
ncbi:Uncharacterised protein [Mycobacteroides abscessus subsp. abscessus]|nr:Uncharacterised protein [Mycobacteroides abscessus subsp. abscessus]